MQIWTQFVLTGGTENVHFSILIDRRIFLVKAEETSAVVDVLELFSGESLEEV